MPEIPKGATVPTDHKKPAAQIEAEHVETVDVEYKGTTYIFPAGLEDADGDVIDAIDDSKISHALRGLLEGGEWERFKATKPRVRDYNDLFGAYALVIGLETSGE